jgi:hypothetical protein
LPSPVRFALLTIRVRAGELDERVFTEFQDIYTAEPVSLELLIAAMMARSMSYVERSQFLLRLDQIVEKADDIGSGYVISALRDLLRRRRSRLDNPLVWRELGFPQELLRLVAK